MGGENALFFSHRILTLKDDCLRIMSEALIKNMIHFKTGLL